MRILIGCHSGILDNKKNLNQKYHSRYYKDICLCLSGKVVEPSWDTYSLEDWKKFSSTAIQEGVGPLLFWEFKKQNDIQNLISLSTLGLLNTSYYQTLAQNYVFFHELTAIDQVLREYNIRYVVLKGAALARTIYSNIGLRPMGDVDLLIRPEVFDECLSLVKKRGYGPVAPELIPGQNKLIGYHTSLRKHNNPKIHIELHWGLIAGINDWREPDKEWFWDQVYKWKIKNEEEEIPVLNSEANLLYLAAHMMLKHGGQQVRLIWYYDLHRLINTAPENGLDWQIIGAKATEFQWREPLYAALLGCQERFHTEIPADFLKIISEKPNTQVQNLVKSKTESTQTHSRLVWDAMRSNSWWGRLIILFGHLFPSREYILFRYHPKLPGLWFIYYPYRWIMILKDGIYTLMNGIRQSWR